MARLCEPCIRSRPDRGWWRWVFAIGVRLDCDGCGRIFGHKFTSYSARTLH